MFADGIQSLEYSQNLNLREVVFHIVKYSSKEEGVHIHLELLSIR